MGSRPISSLDLAGGALGAVVLALLGCSADGAGGPQAPASESEQGSVAPPPEPALPPTGAPSAPKSEPGVGASEPMPAGSPPGASDANRGPMAVSFDDPFVDVDEWRDDPVRHRYVHGGFKGTDLRFSMYFPPEEKYEGRFFHYILPVPGNEHAVSKPEYPDPSYSIGFAVDSGAYLIESNHGALGFDPTADPTVSLWRGSEATAKYSRTLANSYYPSFGDQRPYGYAWGGSGGAFKTIACIENTDGVWDGVVPFIHASPVAMPNNFTVQAHAMRVLRDKVPAIVDAVDPGGSGDMYAGLNPDERAALEEVTRFGFPPDAWFNYNTIAFGYTGVLASLIPAVLLLDRTYVDDFWSMPGYLGADSPEVLEPYRVNQETTVSSTILPADAKSMGLPLTLSASQPSNAEVPAAFVLSELPEGDLQGASITFESGAAMGKTVTIAGEFDGVVVVGYGQSAGSLADIQPGDKVRVDNTTYLALQSYHRHQLPPSEYYVYDQYRDDGGEPRYPQREVKTSMLFNQAGEMSGSFKGKMIVVENLMDEIAFPWHADWYRSKVQAALGDAFDDNYRLWYVEKAMHTPPRPRGETLRPAITTRAVNFGPVLQQALRDLAGWVERDVPPPASTPYDIVEGQVIVPPTADERRGVQPIVVATANGGERADVGVGEEVAFSAVIDVPPGAGSIVGVEWDFEGGGDFPETTALSSTEETSVVVETTHAFSDPGTYFPSVRASSHRDGDPDTSYARVTNLGRVRVVVQ